MSEPCPRCDREECEAQFDAFSHDSACPPRCAGCRHARDCERHAVDWRARALAAEAERDDARETIRAAALTSLDVFQDVFADRDRLWRLAWAAGWAAVGMAVVAAVQIMAEAAVAREVRTIIDTAVAGAIERIDAAHGGGGGTGR